MDSHQPDHKKRKSSSSSSNSSSNRSHSAQPSCCPNPSSSSSSSELSPTSPLNTNPHWSSTASCPSVSPTVTPPCAVVPTVRSVVPVGAPAPSDDGGSAQTLGKSLSPADLVIHETSAMPTKRHRGRDVIDQSSSLLPSSSSLPPSGYSPSPLVNSATPPCLSAPLPPSSRPIKKAVSRRAGSSRSSKSSSGGPPGGSSSNKLSLSQSEWEELKRLREIPASQNGVSMKRKAVMEAIGEILKKMYAQRVKGKVPGTFKGRFSSEFTCDSDMHDIIHSRTTMTSYGEMLMDGGSQSGHNAASKCDSGEASSLTKARFKENEELRDKVALLKWRMQQQKAMKGLKRRRTGEATPTDSKDWTEEGGADECDLNSPPLKLRKKTGFCGLKRGFLLAD